MERKGKFYKSHGKLSSFTVAWPSKHSQLFDNPFAMHLIGAHSRRLSFILRLATSTARSGNEEWKRDLDWSWGLGLGLGSGQWAWPRGQKDDTPAAAYDNVLPLNGGGRWTLKTEDGTEAEAEDGAGAGAEPESRRNAWIRWRQQQRQQLLGVEVSKLQ
ncbi:hypothetical protein ACLKA6_001210 [Drosophila palustris]